MPRSGSSSDSTRGRMTSGVTDVEEPVGPSQQSTLGFWLRRVPGRVSEHRTVLRSRRREHSRKPDGRERLRQAAPSPRLGLSLAGAA